MTITIADRAIADKVRAYPETEITKALNARDFDTLDAMCRIHFTKVGISQRRQAMLVQEVATLRATPPGASNSSLESKSDRTEVPRG